MARDKDDTLIYSNDWYTDRAGRQWALVYVDVDAKKVRLRSLDPPEKTVSLAELRAKYKLASTRAFLKKSR